MTSPPRGQRSTGRRSQVLQLLRDAPGPLDIIEIADRLGIHVNTARFHLQTLLGNGQVERSRAERGTSGRPPQLFRAVRGMDPMGRRHYRVLAEVLATSLATEPDPRGRAAEAGRSWGRLQASTCTNADQDQPVEAAESVEMLVGMLDELGFAPEVTAGGESPAIGLRSCPFLELAVDRSEVVCPVHLGLMQGAMESWDSPVTVDRLDAFVEPNLCLAHLTAVGAP